VSRRNTEADFWKLVAKRPDDLDACWIWLGRKPQKYGRFRFNGLEYQAHRLAYFFSKGPIPYGLCVCHHCDNPPCCNPDHLFIGTKTDNTLDCVNKNRHSRGEIHGKTPLTEDDVRTIRKVYRFSKGGRNGAPNSTPKLAERFGVSPQSIWAIVHRKSWRHVT
jgi:hypothetical protein